MESIKNIKLSAWKLQMTSNAYLKQNNVEFAQISSLKIWMTHSLREENYNIWVFDNGKTTSHSQQEFHTQGIWIKKLVPHILQPKLNGTTPKTLVCDKLELMWGLLYIICGKEYKPPCVADSDHRYNEHVDSHCSLSEELPQRGRQK